MHPYHQPASSTVPMTRNHWTKTVFDSIDWLTLEKYLSTVVDQKRKTL